MKSKIARNYAKALYLSAVNEKKVDLWKQELDFVKEILHKQTHLSSVLNSVVVDDEAKKKLLEKIFKDRIDPKLLFFFSLLIEKKRFSYLNEISECYSEQALKHNSQLKVDLIVAVKATKEIIDLLVNKLETHFKKKIEVIEKIDPKIMGGFIIKIGNHLIDASLKSQMEALKQNLLALRI